MAEWLKAHDSKSCKGNTFGGSNPLASARKRINKNSPFGLIFICLSGKARMATVG